MHLYAALVAVLSPPRYTNEHQKYLLDMLCVLIQGDPELVSAMYGRGIAYGKKSLQVSDVRS